MSQDQKVALPVPPAEVSGSRYVVYNTKTGVIFAGGKGQKQIYSASEALRLSVAACVSVNDWNLFSWKIRPQAK